MKFDLGIENATIVDGIQKAYHGGVYLRHGKIAYIGNSEDADCGTRIDAGGRVLCPGFIDIHRHGDLVPFYPETSVEIQQGITTMVNGNCGFSAAPNRDKHFDALQHYAEPIIGKIPECLRGTDMADFFAMAEEKPVLLNHGYFVGNGALRIAVKGFESTPMSRKELDGVLGLLNESLDAGALGLSLGLLYIPESFYTDAELLEISRTVADHGKPIAAHIRGEGNSLLESVEEMISLAEQTGVRMHISHFKAAGKNNWNHAIRSALEKMEAAREKGADITFDLYPYAAGSTTLMTLMPPEAQKDGLEGFLKLTEKLEGRRWIIDQLRKEQSTWDNLAYSTGWENVMIAGSSKADEIGYDLKSLAEKENLEPEEFALNLLSREKGNVPIVFHHMAQEDVDYLLCRKESFLISDSLYSSGGIPHPRKYGTSVHFLKRYVQEKKILTLEDAIGKMTRLPAEFMRFTDRGIIKVDAWADLVLLNLSQLEDRATYTDPARYPGGIDLCVVNGSIVFEKGVIRNYSAGQLLRK